MLTSEDPPYLAPTPDTNALGLSNVPGAVYANNRFGTLTGTPTNFAGLPVLIKTIVEDFDPGYGRMNALLGTERTSLDPAGQNAFGFHYIDPATETIPDGTTQVWSIIHNGVDTHAIHFHLVNVQLINRVDWAGVVKPPDANELGWKETIRMNPLENVVVAVRPKKQRLNFGMPKSIRPLDVTMPIGSTAGFTNPGPNGLPTTNAVVDFNWEYVWHCHLLGHEENDMMRSIAMQVTTSAPARPQPLSLSRVTSPTLRVRLSWPDATPATDPATLGNPANEVGFQIQRATSSNFTQNLRTYYAPANATSYDDTTVVAGTRYYYRVRAFNASNVAGTAYAYSNFSSPQNIIP